MFYAQLLTTFWWAEGRELGNFYVAEDGRIFHFIGFLVIEVYS